MNDLILSIQDLYKTYGDGREGVRGLSLDVGRGEFFALLGSSGSGKTTALKAINRLVEATSGRIRFNDLDVAQQDPVQLRRQIGYVFQEIGLFPHMTVAQNIAVVPRLLGWSATRVDERIGELLQMVSLPSELYRNRFPAELSGGQQQRVGVARALAAQPALVLMDEPFGALDPVTRTGLQDEYLKFHRLLGLTTIMVTHDVAEALLMADRIGVLDSGRLVALGTPAELLRGRGEGALFGILDKPIEQWKRLASLIESGERP